MISVAILAYLLVGVPSLGVTGWVQVVFWIFFPDLVAFVPIGLSSQRREWPSWGASLYNLTHTLLVFAASFAGLWLITGGFYWPLLGWFGHITVDRAVGYGLRARPSAKEARA